MKGKSQTIFAASNFGDGLGVEGHLQPEVVYNCLNVGDYIFIAFYKCKIKIAFDYILVCAKVKVLNETLEELQEKVDSKAGKSIQPHRTKSIGSTARTKGKL